MLSHKAGKFCEITQTETRHRDGTKDRKIIYFRPLLMMFVIRKPFVDIEGYIIINAN